MVICLHNHQYAMPIFTNNSYSSSGGSFAIMLRGFAIILLTSKSTYKTTFCSSVREISNIPSNQKWAEKFPHLNNRFLSKPPRLLPPPPLSIYQSGAVPSCFAPLCHNFFLKTTSSIIRQNKQGQRERDGGREKKRKRSKNGF